MPNGKAGFSHKQCRPRTTLVGGFFLPSSFPNSGHNQSASRIIALTFLTKNVSNESAFFVQRAHPYRAFLRNHIRTNFKVPSTLTVPTVPTVPSALTMPRVPRVPIPLTVPTGLRVPYSSHSTYRSESSDSSQSVSLVNQSQHIHEFSHPWIILFFVTCILINGVTNLCDCTKCWKYIFL